MGERRSARVFSTGDRDELLKSLGVARQGCIKALARLPAGRTVMRSGVDCLIADIDELAGLLTSKLDYFHSSNSSYG